jgi:hypothetical protein
MVAALNVKAGSARDTMSSDGLRKGYPDGAGFSRVQVSFFGRGEPLRARMGA